MPISVSKLVIEPRYPIQTLNGTKMPDGDDEKRQLLNYERVGQGFDFGDGSGTIWLINTWYSEAKRSHVYVYHTGDGRSRVSVYGHSASYERLSMSIHTMGAVAEHAWPLEAELTAQQKLQTLVTENAFRCYLMTGQFLETSKRSRVTYLFRRGRPTVALRQDGDFEMRVLAALCLHPIGYYDETFAGVMVPTDDVIAHLLLMRSDERYFWAKCNHHPLWSAAAGL